MTFPGNLGYQVPTDPLTSIVRRIEDLERTQREMSTQLVNQGSVAVADGSGNQLTLAQFAFGLQVVSTPATFTAVGGSAWHVDSLETPITVVAPTGRILVAVSSVLYTSLSAGNAVMSWTITDSSGTQVVAANNQRALVEATAGYPAAGYGSSTYLDLHAGLTAGGTFTVQSNYRCDDYGATVDTANFENRTLFVWPL